MEEKGKGGEREIPARGSRIRRVRAKVAYPALAARRSPLISNLIDNEFATEWDVAVRVLIS